MEQPTPSTQPNGNAAANARVQTKISEGRITSAHIDFGPMSGGGNRSNQNRDRSHGSRSNNRDRDRSRRPQTQGMNSGRGVSVIRTGEDADSSGPKVVAVASKTLRFAPLGGLEEVGKNMQVFEYGKDIIVVDAGFMFPEEDMPGIDYVIPDTTYIEQNKDRIRGIFITHAHMDHIGALPYILDKLGNPPIYGTRLVIGMIKKRLEEFGMDRKANMIVLNPDKDEIATVGELKVEPFRVNHNIPDGTGLIIHSPVGKVIVTSDFKFDYTPINEPVIDIPRIAKVGREGVLALFCDSTNATKPGYSVSEREIAQNMEEIFAGAHGRIFVASFSSLISRIQTFIDVAEKLNRKITIVGRSMLQTVEVARELGFLRVPGDLILPVHEIVKLPDEKIVVISTGTQGEASSALSRMSRGEHKNLKIKSGDTVILSSSIIPGNERSVQQVYDNLTKEGAKVINYQLMDIHTGGHAQAEELKLMVSLVRPKYFVPIHGNRYLLAANAEIAQSVGVPAENCFVMSNGQMLELSENSAEISKQRVPSGYVMVDGLGVGDVGNIVLRDRQAMASDGIFVVILTVDHNTNQILTSPDIISRGFVYMRAAEDLIFKARQEIKRLFKQNIAKKPSDWQYLKTAIREDMGEFLFRETQRRPMVIPVIIEV